MKTVVIDRQRWGMGALRRVTDQKQCCLGFACEAYGIKVDAMLGIGAPSALPELYQAKLPKWLLALTDDIDVGRAASINDDPNLSWSKKEELLKPIFKKHRINLVFRGTR
jgi:hypothetical protein